MELTPTNRKVSRKDPAERHTVFINIKCVRNTCRMSNNNRGKCIFNPASRLKGKHKATKKSANQTQQECKNVCSRKRKLLKDTRCCCRRCQANAARNSAPGEFENCQTFAVYQQRKCLRAAGLQIIADGQLVMEREHYVRNLSYVHGKFEILTNSILQLIRKLPTLPKFHFNYSKHSRAHL